jgi:adenine-specific DNA-methyltransferase
MSQTNETVKELMPSTPDLNAERLATLKELFPDLFTDEGSLNEDELKKLIDPKSVNETERYEFRWFGKSNAKRKAFTPTTATLNYDAARSVNPHTIKTAHEANIRTAHEVSAPNIGNAHEVSASDGEKDAYSVRVSDVRVENPSENLIIEGENLKVLKLLLCGYREQIKCIYIDPPYNTGKDFVYSDNYSEDRLPYWKQTNVVDEYGVKIDTNADTDGRYHSNWMNMMFSRLLVARQLLRKDGVIFISIDDNEVHNLRRLCNEVFGEDNFIGQIVWKRRASSALAEKNISSDHEYVICYQKSDNFQSFLGEQKDFSSYSNPNNDPRGDWVLGDLTVGMGRNLRPNQYYDLVDPKTGKIYKPNPNRVWAYIPESMDKLIKEDQVFFPEDNTKRPMIKRFKNQLKSDRNPLSTFVENIGSNSEGTREIQNIFESSLFTYSKPVSLIKMLISNFENNSDEDYFLDFFAGSGTTGQAVMELNEADGGNRKFILVQLPELTDEKSEAYKAGYKRISDITIERNKRVVERIIAEKAAKHPNLFDQIRNAHEVSASDGEEHAYFVRVSDEKDALKNLGFKVFKLEGSYFPRTEWNPDPEKSEAENVQSLKDYIAAKESQLRIDFDRDKLLTEILLKEGFKLNYTVKPFKIRTAHEVSANSKREDTLTAVRGSDKNEILHVADADKEALICLDNTIETETVEYFKTNKDLKFICLELGLDTTKKWNLANSLGEKFRAI